MHVEVTLWLMNTWQPRKINIMSKQTLDQEFKAEMRKLIVTFVIISLVAFCFGFAAGSLLAGLLL